MTAGNECNRKHKNNYQLQSGEETVQPQWLIGTVNYRFF